ncbi:hypothetical protein BH11CYA1_BH11CYA1_39230 [soil metagenome]
MSMLSLNKGSRRALLTLCVCMMSSGAALAQVANDFDMSTVAPAAGDNRGTPHPQSDFQPNYVPSPSQFTNNQRLDSLAYATRTILSQRSQRLPKTTLDSFVYQAGGQAEQIYGDEGTSGLPPINGMGGGNVINAGIHSNKLTTDHKSDLPSVMLTYY